MKLKRLLNIAQFYFYSKVFFIDFLNGSIGNDFYLLFSMFLLYFVIQKAGFRFSIEKKEIKVRFILPSIKIEVK